MNKVAVYGSLKQGFGNHRVMGDSYKFLGTDIISGWVMHSLGGFPAIRKSDNNNKILIEVYEVNDETLKSIYRLEGYTGTRDHERNWYDTETVLTKYGYAEIFYFKNELDAPIVESGNW